MRTGGASSATPMIICPLYPVDRRLPTNGLNTPSPYPTPMPVTAHLVESQPSFDAFISALTLIDFTGLAFKYPALFDGVLLLRSAVFSFSSGVSDERSGVNPGDDENKNRFIMKRATKAHGDSTSKLRYLLADPCPSTAPLRLERAIDDENIVYS